MKIPDNFLLDEIRCGFFIPAAIKQAWAAELEVLMEIDRVCKKHQIQYFADWGTLLGTVRHGGFIPWDDDLDIVMKREDYQKFMTVARFEMEEGFHVQTYRNQKDFWLFMGKVVGKNQICFEKEHLRRFHNFPYIACVDIFVLDYVYRDPKKEEERRGLCKYLLAVADDIVDRRLPVAEQEQKLQTIETMYGKKFKRIADSVEMARYLYGEVEELFAKVPESESDTLTQLFPWGLMGNERYYPKEYYEKAIDLPFECITMPVPVLYDKMLRQRYGEYMRLVKDGGAHDYPFFEGQKTNLQKVLDFKLPEFEFSSAMLDRSKEEYANKNLSYKAMAKECVDELQNRNIKLLEAVEIEEVTMEVVQKEQKLEESLHLIQMSQQLAIDFGTMLEQILGEGCHMIHLLEQYCEILYLLYEQLVQSKERKKDIGKNQSICMRLKQIQEEIALELEEGMMKRKSILFLPVMAKDWNSLHRLWEEAKEDASCDVFVVPLPYYYKDYDNSPKKVCCETSEFPIELQALDYQFLTAEYLELLHPDCIMIQNPYDEWNSAIAVPEMFYAKYLRRYTDELIYVPPFKLDEFTEKNEREYFNMKYYVTMPGVITADRILVQSEKMKQVYIKKLTEFAGEETEEIWEQRIKTLEVSKHTNGEKEKTAQNKKRTPKKLLYGISRGTYMEDEVAAQQKIERSWKIFEEQKEHIQVTMYYFPEDGTCSVKDFDAYYGDPMPIVMEFRQMGKPVMLQDVSL